MQGSIKIHSPPGENLNPALPPIFDTDSLAAEIGCRGSTLWHYIIHPRDGYDTFQLKTGKKTRTIHAPKPSVKYYSTNILHTILDPLHNQLGNHVTAYRTGKTIRDAVLQHIPECPICDKHYPQTAPRHADCPKRGIYIHLDLQDFFHSTSRWMVREYFEQQGLPEHVASQIASLCTIPIHGRMGVPQGNPVSGALCNLVADARLDPGILRYIAKLNQQPRFRGAYRWVYTRYSDDLALTCGRKLSVAEIRDVIRDLYRIVRKAGYTPNTRKTRWVRSCGKFQKRLLGSLIHQIPNCSTALYDRVKGILHRCLKYGLEQESAIAAEHHAIPNLHAWLTGNINWINQLNPRRGAKLRKRLQELNDTLLHIGG